MAAEITSCEVLDAEVSVGEAARIEVSGANIGANPDSVSYEVRLDGEMYATGTLQILAADIASSQHKVFPPAGEHSVEVVEL